MSVIIDGTNGVTASGGLYAQTTFGGTYTDGIVADYTTGLGRISVGASDGLAFYRGGLANTESMRIDSSGKVNVGPAAAAIGQGIFAVYSDSAGAPATSGSSDAYITTRVRVSSVALDTGVYGSGTAWIQNRSYNNYATNYDMCVQPNGGYFIAGTSATAGGHTFSTTLAAGSQTLTIVKASVAINTANNYYMQFNGSNGADGYIQTNGSSVLTIVDASDARLKENIVDATYGLNTVMALRPVEYSWIGDERRVKGFIAQEVKEVLPESVPVKDESATGGLEDLHLLEMQTMIPVLVKAIQEQQAIIEQLRADVAALKGNA